MVVISIGYSIVFIIEYRKDRKKSIPYEFVQFLYIKTEPPIQSLWKTTRQILTIKIAEIYKCVIFIYIVIIA